MTPTPEPATPRRAVPMKPPSLVAENLKKQLGQYLGTTYGLVDDNVREALSDFLTDREDGVFRGPYLRVRTPFRPSARGWDKHLEWLPAGFVPHQHQAQAWQRLSSLNHSPQPTLVTTGTGSGKTESFLYPVLDHCRRHARTTGVKALLLYPMNALATDQAERINDLLSDPALADVSAGLYVGEEAKTGYDRVMTSRAVMRTTPPDILITNYKMLDLLLQRPEDTPLWSNDALAYVVVDEFHTYDGAQGTDVAMLLRRLRAAAGDYCPVATSATLDSDGNDNRSTDADANPDTDLTGGAPERTKRDSTTLICDTAATVFGTPFPPESVITEDRLGIHEIMGPPKNNTLPSPSKILALPDPYVDENALDDLAALVTGKRGLTPSQLGAELKQHRLLQLLLEWLSDGNVHSLTDYRDDAGTWLLRTVWAGEDPDTVTQALSRCVALLSAARDPQDPTRPFMHVEVHLWVRAVNRLLREVRHRPRFAWESAGAQGSLLLPSIHCRHCGRSGWTAIAPETAPEELKVDLDQIYRAIGNNTRKRNLITATAAEVAGYRAADGDGVELLALDGHRLVPLDKTRHYAIDDPRATHAAEPDTEPGADTDTDGEDTAPGIDAALTASDVEPIPVWVDLKGRYAGSDRCPLCRMDNGIRYIGTGSATLTSVVVTNLFTGAIQKPADRKTLLFSNSVQDAAHRAGFLSARSHGFSLRSLLTSALDDTGPRRLNDVIADAVEEWAHSNDPAAAIPPDLHDDTGVAGILEAHDSGSPETWRLLSERFAFSAIMEVGLRSRQGRTLELTHTAAVEPAVADMPGLVATARGLVQRYAHNLSTGSLSDTDFDIYIRGLLERLRLRGAISHVWLKRWILQGGTRRWPIWGGRDPGMPPFPHGQPAPEFLLDSDKSTQFVATGAKGTWYADWTRRCLGIADAESRRFLPSLLRALVEADVLATQRTTQGRLEVYGLTPGHLDVHKLTDDDSRACRVGCDTCAWRQTVVPARRELWIGAVCPRFRCPGRLTAVAVPNEVDYYRQMYRGTEPFRVLAAEHTGSLTREQREIVETRFREGTSIKSPNVLSATSTLELGIDIGALSAVVLGGAAPSPAAHIQRSGRAGRKTGNSLVVTVTGNRPRDRHFFADPSLMLSGKIVPPSSYLSAAELLRRQYMAFLLDKVGRGQMEKVLPLPRTTAQLFGQWLADFAETAQLGHDTYRAEFLAMFGDGIDHNAVEALNEFTTLGLSRKVKQAKEGYNDELDEYRARLHAMNAAVDELDDIEVEQQRQKRQIRSAMRAVRRKIGEIANNPAHGTLVRYGLLPNYALTDTATTLEASLTRVIENGDDREYQTEVRTYERPARQALTDIAPGNVYYVRGYQHTVSGIDIGGPNDNPWATWRLCAECGYVATQEERQATLTQCPQCRSVDIADTGQQFNVITPTKVFAEDRQDDAHIRDDAEDRPRKFYTTVAAVDVDSARVDSAWRHKNRTFGADYTRNAVVRTFNFGESRSDTDKRCVAGKEIPDNPFWVCAECGGTTARGNPEVDNDSYSGNSKADPRRRHHRPWCKNRSANIDHVPTVLAHELHTEVLRILLPVSTMAVREQVESFEAAFMLGVAANYGGDPQHLDSVVARMPDHETGSVRNFVVLYDVLPGGTGYLERLAPRETTDPGREFLTVLKQARELIHACDCPLNSACHRCLLRWTRESKYLYVTRREALRLIDDLLQEWEIEKVSGIHDISMLSVDESELERRFVEKLEAWAKGQQGVSLRPTAHGEAELRISNGHDRTIAWHVKQQHTIEYTRPDILFTRLDAEPVQIALYLDGFRYHASTEHNRLADDATKRNRLHAQDIYVFSVTWDDVDAWRESQVAKHWPPYGDVSKNQARRQYRARGGDGSELDATIWSNPVDTLMAFLCDPDPQRWQYRAEAAIVGAMVQAKWQALGNSAFTRGAITAGINGEPKPDASGGKIMTCFLTDDNDLPMTVCVDSREANALTVLTVLDDTAGTLKNDVEAHKKRWKSWLYWSNLTQFFIAAGGDAAMLTRTTVGSFDPATLKVCEGTGLIAALQNTEPVSLSDDILPDRIQSGLRAIGPAATLVGIDEVPEEWREIKTDASSDTDLQTLIDALAEAAAPTPEAGYEHSDDAWQAELAWPKLKIAVILDDADEGAATREAFAKEGWDARFAAEWTPSQLLHTLKHGSELWTANSYSSQRAQRSSSRNCPERSKTICMTCKHSSSRTR